MQLLVKAEINLEQGITETKRPLHCLNVVSMPSFFGRFHLEAQNNGAQYITNKSLTSHLFNRDSSLFDEKFCVFFALLDRDGDGRCYSSWP